ncbi:hypothetical protein [Streptomyces microflavus]|uniref:hypothetical protein n=1 Tax=Streptomyces microflavus TaxID=1919 RepID=UPI00381EF18E
MDDKTFRRRLDGLKPVVAERLPYFLKLNADARGTVRLQCPAAGPSPSVNCPRPERLRPARPTATGPPQTVIKLADLRSRASHASARPTIQLPDREWADPPGKEALPAVCGASAISVPSDAAGDLKNAKFRQDSHYLSPTWARTYKPIRSHNESLKGADMVVGNPMHRRVPGQVAQTILIAIMATIGNLDILETWLYERTGNRLCDTDFESIAAAPGCDLSSVPAPIDMGRHPPANL